MRSIAIALAMLVACHNYVRTRVKPTELPRLDLGDADVLVTTGTRDWTLVTKFVHPVRVTIDGPALLMSSGNRALAALSMPLILRVDLEALELVPDGYSARPWHLDFVTGLDPGLAGVRFGFAPIAEISIEPHLATYGPTSLVLGGDVRLRPLARWHSVTPTARAGYSYIMSNDTQPRNRNRMAAALGIESQSHQTRLGSTWDSRCIAMWIPTICGAGSSRARSTSATPGKLAALPASRTGSLSRLN